MDRYLFFVVVERKLFHARARTSFGSCCSLMSLAGKGQRIHNFSSLL